MKSFVHWTVLVGCVVATVGVARADALEDCEGLPEDIARRDELAEGVVVAEARSGAAYLVFPSSEDAECEAYPLARPVAKLRGRFRGGGEVQALQRPGCIGGSCQVALVLRGASPSRPRAWLRTRQDCSEDVTLKEVALFAGRSSALLVCRATAGAGSIESRTLIDVDRGALTALFTAPIGSHVIATADEIKGGGCSARPIGSLRIERVGDRPLLRVVDPSSGELHDGRGTLAARQLGYDPERRTFIPTGAPDIPTKVDAFAACRRRR